MGKRKVTMLAPHLYQEAGHDTCFGCLGKDEKYNGSVVVFTFLSAQLRLLN